MNQNNHGNKPNNSELEENKTLLGVHVWQLQTTKIETIKKLLPQNDKLDKLIRIAQILDKNQKEITYYQARIRNLSKILGEKTTV